MDDYALVFNAGSSSLKFCVYRRPDQDGWRLDARGQIDGIGSSPSLTARDDAGTKLADEKLDASVRDGRAAFDVLTTWLRGRYAGAKVLGVGHRVVHAAPTTPAPASSHRKS
jgi:acetate kinase